MAEWLLFYLQLKMLLSKRAILQLPNFSADGQKITKGANGLNLRNREKGHGYKVTASPPTCSSLLE